MTTSMSRARSASALVLTVAAVTWTVGALAQESLFPRPAELEPAVQFWTRVYTEVDTHSGFIHDDLRLDIVYETIRVSEDLRGLGHEDGYDAVHRYARCPAPPPPASKRAAAWHATPLL